MNKEDKQMERSEAPQPWRLESSEQLHDYGIFAVRCDRSRSPRNGTVHDFHFLDAPDGVTVLAVTAQDELVLVEQYRHAVRRVSLETPSGIMEEGEAPEEAGRRELLEETGYQVEEVRKLGAVAINPSWERSHAHVVLARGARPGGERNQDSGEDTRVRLVPLSQVWDLVRQGQIDSAVVVSALHLLRLHQEEGGARDQVA